MTTREIPGRDGRDNAERFDATRRGRTCCPQLGHLNFAWPAAPPLRSASPALPPPLFVVAAATFPAISFAECFVGFALPPMMRAGASCVGPERERRATRGGASFDAVLSFYTTNYYAVGRLLTQALWSPVRARLGLYAPGFVALFRTRDARPASPLTMAEVSEIKLFGKWTYDDVEVRRDSTLASPGAASPPDARRDVFLRSPRLDPAPRVRVFPSRAPF